MEKLSKKLFIIPLVGISSLALGACGGTPSDSSSNSQGGNSSTSETEKLGYVKLDKLSMTAPTYNSAYPSAIGKLNVLCIPVELPSGGFGEKEYHWNQTYLETFKKEMFGSRFDSKNGWNTLESYYETASFNQLDVDGMVTDLFTPTDPNLTMQNLQNDHSLLITLFEQANDWVQTHYDQVDFKDYDLNGDGRLDAVHLITNAPGGREADWSESKTLWPHMGNTYTKPNKERPVIDTYSVSSLGFFQDARTQIHEQGHMIGLEDYYDYTNNAASYIGKADMQDSNTFDWNSFSKMSVGWVKPYVIDGTKDVTEITIGSAALTGDCLVIPANFDTYNQSAFDEYFLIELFTPDGNNTYDWTHCVKPNTYPQQMIDYGDYGVKMYHVDARLWAYKPETSNIFEDINKGHEVKDALEVNAALSEGKRIVLGANNTFNYADYAYPGCFDWGEFPLLALIQPGANTLYDDRPYQFNFLDKEDLWHEGDVFKFSKHSSKLSKMKEKKKTMDNGETFPYEITFKKMSKENVTIEVKKVK